ncbi:MAG: hypothetical protein CMO98_08085 [Woeseia sp.]|nr:hypothetical protein [Woeseia sp.]|tara:strand:- start:1244 stop:2224 length:981 start_codon:yes stop_codon:yes gene_type:complete
MNLSIIIVNYKAWAHIENALAHLKQGFPQDWEIIVVDNESDSHELETYLTKYPEITIIPNPINSGFAVGCRIGVEKAMGKTLLFMNPDVIATVRDIRELITEKESNPEVALLTPKQVTSAGCSQKTFDEFPGFLNQSKILKYLRSFISPGRAPDPRSNHKDLVFCDWITGSFLLIGRSDYDLIGGWCSDYWMYVEDTDLCKRAHEAGLKTAYTPRVQVTHDHGGSSRINIDIHSMTKLEVIISKHVYTQKYMNGLKRLNTHILIGLLRLPVLAIPSFVDVITFGRSTTLNVRRRVFCGLLQYYFRVLRTGSWLSPRAEANRIADCT